MTSQPQRWSYQPEECGSARRWKPGFESTQTGDRDDRDQVPRAARSSEGAARREAADLFLTDRPYGVSYVGKTKRGGCNNGSWCHCRVQRWSAPRDRRHESPRRVRVREDLERIVGKVPSNILSTPIAGYPLTISRPPRLNPCPPMPVPSPDTSSGYLETATVSGDGSGAAGIVGQRSGQRQGSVPAETMPRPDPPAPSAHKVPTSCWRSSAREVRYVNRNDVPVVTSMDELARPRARHPTRTQGCRLMARGSIRPTFVKDVSSTSPIATSGRRASVAALRRPPSRSTRMTTPGSPPNLMILAWCVPSQRDLPAVGSGGHFRLQATRGHLGPVILRRCPKAPELNVGLG